MSKNSSSISWGDSEAGPLLIECWEKSGSPQTPAETEHSVGREAWKVAGATSDSGEAPKTGPEEVGIRRGLNMWKRASWGLMLGRVKEVGAARVRGPALR